MSKFCNNHERRIAEVGHFIADALIVNTVIETGGGGGPRNGCWACALTENQFCRVLKQAAELDAKADAYGGTYTTSTFAISKGGGKS